LEYERTTGFKPTDETAPVPWEQWTLNRESEPQAELAEPEPELEQQPEPEPEPALEAKQVAKATSAFQATVAKVCTPNGCRIFIQKRLDSTRPDKLKTATH
jgi:hypothetical protein